MIRLENKLFKMAVSKMEDDDREIRIESYVLHIDLYIMMQLVQIFKLFFVFEKFLKCAFNFHS
jgi:hypothetical protein